MSFISVAMARQHAFKTADEVEDKAVTVRPSSTALFCVDSADRYKDFVSQSTSPTSPYNFNIQKNESLLNGFFTRIGLTEVVFPYYIPNINRQTYQLSAIIDGPGAPVVLDLSRTAGFGFYSPDALASAIDTELALNGLGGATVSYREGRFFIDAGVGHTIQFVRGNYAGGPYTNDFQAIDLLGLNNPVNLTAVRQQTSSVTRCRFTEFVDIVCSQLTYNQDLKDGSSSPVVRDMLARIYIETENDQPIPVINTGTATGTNVDNTIPGTYPFTIFRQFKTPKMIKWDNTQPLGNLRFEVYDDRGKLLSANLLPGAGLGTGSDYNMPDWRFTLLVSEN